MSAEGGAALGPQDHQPEREVPVHVPVHRLGGGLRDRPAARAAHRGQLALRRDRADRPVLGLLHHDGLPLGGDRGVGGPARAADESGGRAEVRLGARSIGVVRPRAEVRRPLSPAAPGRRRDAIWASRSRTPAPAPTASSTRAGSSTTVDRRRPTASARTPAVPWPGDRAPFRRPVPPARPPDEERCRRLRCERDCVRADGASRSGMLGRHAVGSARHELENTGGQDPVRRLNGDRGVNAVQPASMLRGGRTGDSSRISRVEAGFDVSVAMCEVPFDGVRIGSGEPSAVAPSRRPAEVAPGCKISTAGIRMAAPYGRPWASELGPPGGGFGG